MFLCKLAALIVGFLALGLAALGLACFPPILERGILAAGQLEPGPGRLLWYGLAVLFLFGAVAIARRALRLWAAAPGFSAKRIHFALVTVALSAILAFAAAEPLARLLLPPEKVLSGDAFHRYVWISNNRAEASAETLNPSVPSDRYDSYLGWAPAENYRSDRLSVNAQGLRGTREHPLAKPNGERRIVVTGDSFTFGEGVADDEVYTEVLDAMLEDTRVVNIAVHGYGTDQQYLRLGRIGFDYDPDLVILAYYKTNAARNVLAFRDYAKPRFRLSAGRLELDNVPVPAPTDPSVISDPPAPLSYFGALVRKNLRKAAAYTKSARQWKLTLAILDAALEDTQKRRVPFALVYIPAARPRLSPSPEAAETVLAGWAAERGVPFLDLRPLFLEMPAEQRGGLYRGHWTPEGHRVAAEIIARWLGETGLLPTSASEL
jgi:hypothetical protein